MKRIMLLFVLACSAIFTLQSYAQQSTLDVVNKPYGSGNSMIVIKPNIDNFLKLLNMSEYQFVQIMKNYKYFTNESMRDGKYVAYWNGSIDNYAYAKCVNSFSYNIMRKEIRFFVRNDMVYPQGSMQDLYRSLRDYHVGSMQGTDKFSFTYNGDTYEFYITPTNNMYDIQVLKK